MPTVSDHVLRLTRGRTLVQAQFGESCERFSSVLLASHPSPAHPLLRSRNSASSRADPSRRWPGPSKLLISPLVDMPGGSCWHIPVALGLHVLVVRANPQTLLPMWRWLWSLVPVSFPIGVPAVFTLMARLCRCYHTD